MGRGLYFLPLSVGQAYLWVEPSGVTMVDTGGPGSTPEIESAFAKLGLAHSDLRRVVLTHGHGVNAGAAAEIGSWPGVEIIAHHLDAPVIGGEVKPAPPDDTGQRLWLTAELISALASYSPVQVDTEVDSGDDLGFGGGAFVISAPGHTAGSMAVYLPQYSVLFSGGAVIRTPDGAVSVSRAADDPRAARLSLIRLSLLDVSTLCPGYGHPLTTGAGEQMRTAVSMLSTAEPGADVGVGGQCAW